MKRTLSLLVASLLSMSLFAAAANAHVVVFPRETTQGAYEKFTVRVPSEIDGTRTTAVEVNIPDDVNVSRVEPKPGWEYELVRDDTDKVVSILWTAVGEGLAVTEFAEFNMQGRVGDQAESLVWKAYQTYEDGTVVEWVGAEGSSEPASVTAVNAPEAGGGEAQAASSSAWPAILSAAALLLSLAALILALRKKS